MPSSSLEAYFWSVACTAEHLLDVGRMAFAVQIWTLPPLGTLNRLNAASSRKLTQFFNRYATYNGSDPHRAPAMMRHPHLEHGIGTFLPEGGMRAIPLHLEALAKSLGVTFLTDTPARRILHDRGRVTGVEDEHAKCTRQIGWSATPTCTHVQTLAARFEGP